MSKRTDELEKDIKLAEMCYTGLDQDIENLLKAKPIDNAAVAEKLSEKLKVGEMLLKLKKELDIECIREKNQPSDADQKQIMLDFYAKNNPGSQIRSTYKIGVDA